MALKGMKMGLAMVLLTSMWAVSMAQSGCTTAIISLSPCLSYITGNASSTPSSSCCTQLANVVQTQPQCLCTLLNGGGSSLGLNINQTQALALPAACNVQTPPASQCNAAGGAGGAAPPAQTPASPTAPLTPTTPSAPSDDTPATPLTPSVPTTKPTTPSVPSIPSGSGSKTVPATGGDASDAKSIIMSLPLVSSLLFISAYASALMAF